MVQIVVAYQTDRGIGHENTIPWKVLEDLQEFKRLTMGTAVIMGRKTWESLPVAFRPLKDRLNIVLTRGLNEFPGISEPDVFVCSGIYSAIELAKQNNRNVSIIGGAEIYQLALDLGIVDKVYATEIRLGTECDTFFPELPSIFQPMEIGTWKLSKGGVKYRFSTFTKSFG